MQAALCEVLVDLGMPVLTVRPEVLEYGSIPIASWLPRLDSHAALQTLAHQLGQVATRDDSGRCEHCCYGLLQPFCLNTGAFASRLISSLVADMVDLTVLARTMEVPYQHAGVCAEFLLTLEFVPPTHHDRGGFGSMQPMHI